MAAHCGCLASGQASIAEAIMPKIRYRKAGSTGYTLVFAEGLVTLSKSTRELDL
jgi:hypothetical protein